MGSILNFSLEIMKIGTMTELDCRALSHCLFVVSESFERVKKGINQEDSMEKNWYIYKELRRSSSEEAGRPSLLLPLHPQKTGVGLLFALWVRLLR